MRAVVQRVSRARVVVDGRAVGVLAQPGLVVLVGVHRDDTAAAARDLAAKVYSLRILAGDVSCAETGAPILVVSQFTLYADTRKGRRPSWSAAAPAAAAQPLVDTVVGALRTLGATVETGLFGEHMQLELVNDGPMTLILDTDGTSR